jgi:hypothetical protein
LHAGAFEELGIDERDDVAATASARDVDHANAQRHADLRRGQPDPRRRVHRLDHVVDEGARLVGDLRHDVRRAREHGIAVADDRTDHRASSLAAMRCW